MIDTPWPGHEIKKHHHLKQALDDGTYNLDVISGSSGKRQSTEARPSKSVLAKKWMAREINVTDSWQGITQTDASPSDCCCGHCVGARRACSFSHGPAASGG
jgi:hypothetical protein